MNATASKIRQLRKEQRLSQRDLAQLIGVSNQAVCFWERGVSLPTQERLTLIAQALDCSADDLAALIKIDRATISQPAVA